MGRGLIPDRAPERAIECQDDDTGCERDAGDHQEEHGRVLIEIVGAEHRTGMVIRVIAGAILLLSFAVLVLKFGSPCSS